jgi:hypothetical protein
MTVSVQSWETKNLLLNHVQRNSPSVVVGSASEAPRGFYSYSVDEVDCPILIGVMVNQSKAPRALILPASQRVVLGYDQSIALVDCPSGKLLGTTLLDGVFFEFLRDEERGQVIVVHELGVVAISELGEELWRYTTCEILEDWRKVNGFLVLALMDTNEALELNLESGVPATSPATPDS